jgi:hypothetical protein
VKLLNLNSNYTSFLEDEFNVTITFHLNDEYENLVFISSTALTNLPFKVKKGFFKFFCRIPPDLLNHGKFTISKFFVLKDSSKLLYEHNDLLTFEISHDIIYENGQSGKIEGIMKPKLNWEFKATEQIENPV